MDYPGREVEKITVHYNDHSSKIVKVGPDYKAALASAVKTLEDAAEKQAMKSR